MREIGSELWDVPTGSANSLFPESTQWFLSGRCALNAIIQDLNDCHTVGIPSWCCDSMVKPFVDAGMEMHFYPVFYSGGLSQEMIQGCDVMLLLNYFGYSAAAPDLSGYKGIVIRDVTHSVFAASYCDADYYFGSLRKWCGIWTGGFAWTKKGHSLKISDQTDQRYVRLREEAMREKADYMRGNRLDKSYLAAFKEAEAVLENAGFQQAADRDVTLAKKLDVEFIRNRRQSNARILSDAFPEWLIFPQINDTDCPLFVPILVPDGKRDEMRRYLIKSDIFCPIHWPISKYHRIDDRARYLYENELSVVCDQRYTEEDMHRVVETIRLYWKEL